MNIAFDVDGVIYPWHEAAFEYAKLFLGAKESTVGEYFEDFEEKHPRIYIDNLLNTRHLVSIKFPKKADVLTLKNLSKENRIYYITAIPKELGISRKIWLKKHGFPYAENLILTNHHDKDYYARYYEIDLFIEDRLANAEYLSKITRVILIKRPWNKDGREKFECINTLQDLERILK